MHWRHRSDTRAPAVSAMAAAPSPTFADSSVTGTWLKALAMAPPENLAYAVEHLNDATHQTP